jgi:hypothetical protein
MLVTAEFLDVCDAYLETGIDVEEIPQPLLATFMWRIKSNR